MTTDADRPARAALPGVADAGVRRTLRRRILLPTTILFAGLALFGLTGVQIPTAVQLVPFAVSMVLFGLPHGALDHLVPARLGRRPVTLRNIGIVVALYGGLGALVLAVWWAAPLAAFWLFIVMTWFHWGQGDRWVMAEIDGDGATRSGVSAVLAIAARGALPMIVPLIFHPEQYARVLTSAVGTFGADTAGIAATVSSPGLRFALAAGVGVLLLAQLLADLVRSAPAQRRRILAGHAVESVVLFVFFAALPPVFAVGVYFTLWHSIRHIIRLGLLDDPTRAALERGRIGVLFARFAQDAWPITLTALALLVVFAAAVPRPADDPSAALGLYLVFISALTLPHVVIVTIMDRAQGMLGGAASREGESSDQPARRGRGVEI